MAKEIWIVDKGLTVYKGDIQKFKMGLKKVMVRAKAKKKKKKRNPKMN